MLTTDDNIYTVLNGELKLIEIENVPRPTQDPFWLCEYVEPHIKEGASVLDAGCGNGIIALILAKHKNANVEAVEIENTLVNAAKINARLNNLKNIHFTHADFLSAQVEGKYMHVVSNPPYHSTEKGYQAHSEHKQLAHGASEDMMLSWVKKSIRLTQRGGTCTLIHHAANVDGFEHILKQYNTTVTPVQTHPDRPAKRVIIHIQK